MCNTKINNLIELLKPNKLLSYYIFFWVKGLLSVLKVFILIHKLGTVSLLYKFSNTQITLYNEFLCQIG